MWQDRLLRESGLTCRHCGTPWEIKEVKDLKARKRQTQWAQWNFSHEGSKWPMRTFKQALLEPPPGLQGGQPRRKAKKNKPTALQKAVQEHWTTLPPALRTQCEALGIQASEPPAPPDLPTLIKEHLQSLPSDLKEAAEKLVEPPKPATKLKQSVGQLKQLAGKKAVIQQKADAVKTQCTSLLQELKEMQTKIETAQQELRQTTSLYNQQLEKEKLAAAAGDTTQPPPL